MQCVLHTYVCIIMWEKVKSDKSASSRNFAASRLACTLVHVELGKNSPFPGEWHSKWRNCQRLACTSLSFYLSRTFCQIIRPVPRSSLNRSRGSIMSGQIRVAKFGQIDPNHFLKALEDHLAKVRNSLAWSNFS